jgi:hypothetical protein
MSALRRQIVSHLGTGVADAYPEHRKAALQFNRTVFYAFLGAELGLKPFVDLNGKTGFGQFDRSARHSKSVVVGANLRIWLR